MEKKNEKSKQSAVEGKASGYGDVEVAEKCRECKAYAYNAEPWEGDSNGAIIIDPCEINITNAESKMCKNSSDCNECRLNYWLEEVEE